MPDTSIINMTRSESDNTLTKSASITVLEDLNDVKKGNYVQTFMANMNLVFQFNGGDIQKQVSQEENDLLMALRKSLIERLQRDFPQFSDRRPVNRLVKRTTVPDIFHLGYSFTNKSLTIIYSALSVPSGNGHHCPS